MLEREEQAAQLACLWWYVIGQYELAWPFFHDNMVVTDSDTFMHYNTTRMVTENVWRCWRG